MKNHILLLITALIILTSCNIRPRCTNTNPIFDTYSPDSKIYKDELIKEIKKNHKSKLRYWLKEYAERDGEELIYFYIQSDSLCAIIEINMNPVKRAQMARTKYDGRKEKHSVIGKTRTGIEFRGLMFDIVKDSSKTAFIYRDYISREFD